jgi:hypothetical protein
MVAANHQQGGSLRKAPGGAMESSGGIIQVLYRIPVRSAVYKGLSLPDAWHPERQHYWHPERLLIYRTHKVPGFTMFFLHYIQQMKDDCCRRVKGHTKYYLPYLATMVHHIQSD